MSITKLALAGAAATLILGAGAAFAVQGGQQPSRVVSLDVKGPSDEAEHAAGVRSPIQVPEDRGVVDDDVSRGVDISGPCDEAEHANDPRCTGVEREDIDDDDAVAGRGVDISGPCDEAEHANDPRCTGAVIDEDRSGSDDEFEDRFDDSPGFDDHGGSSGHGGSGRDHPEDD